MITATSDIEKSLWQKGYKSICGIDEVGRGCFAGPVVAGAVIFSSDCVFPKGIADSKLLKPVQREVLSELIKGSAYAWAVGEISVQDINKFGIGKATQMAFRKAVKSLSENPDFLLIDAFYIKQLNRKKQMAVPGGDKLSVSIAAASIIAKVYRDNLMKALHEKYPDYGFAKHKGYGTKFHQDAIRKYGLTKLHRTSFNLTQFIS
jgi:ribonuclease HII